MDIFNNIIGGYLVVINLLALVLYGWDKYCAVKHRWRVAENVLLAVAAGGGSIGALFGMQMFHHKLRKQRFSWGIPLIFLGQLVGAVYLHG